MSAVEALERQAALLDALETKHLGPGPHPSGSPQLAHAGGGAAKRLLEDVEGFLTPPDVLDAALDERIPAPLTEAEIDAVLESVRTYHAEAHGVRAPHVYARAREALASLDARVRRELRPPEEVEFPEQAGLEALLLLRELRRENGLQHPGAAWPGIAGTVYERLIDHAQTLENSQRAQGIADDDPAPSWAELRADVAPHAFARLLRQPIADDVVLKRHVQRRLGARLAASDVTDAELAAFHVSRVEHHPHGGYVTDEYRVELADSLSAVLRGETDAEDDEVYVLDRRMLNLVPRDRIGRADLVLDTPEKMRLGLAQHAADLLVAQWARTANDNHALSLAIQEAAAAEFDLPDEGVMDWDFGRHGRELAEQVETTYREHRDLLHAFVRAQYDETQAAFREAGVTHVELYRGFTWDGHYDVPEWAQRAKTPPSIARRLTTEDDDYVAIELAVGDVTLHLQYDLYAMKFVATGGSEGIDVQRANSAVRDPSTPREFRAWLEREVAYLPLSGTRQIELRPLSSFTASEETAEEFARSGLGPGLVPHPSAIVTAEVPVERIVGTPRTGVGAYGEAEFVVLGGWLEAEVLRHD